MPSAFPVNKSVAFGCVVINKLYYFKIQIQIIVAVLNCPFLALGSELKIFWDRGSRFSLFLFFGISGVNARSLHACVLNIPSFLFPSCPFKQVLAGFCIPLLTRDFRINRKRRLRPLWLSAAILGRLMLLERQDRIILFVFNNVQNNMSGKTKFV